MPWSAAGTLENALTRSLRLVHDIFWSSPQFFSDLSLIIIITFHVVENARRVKYDNEEMFSLARFIYAFHSAYKVNNAPLMSKRLFVLSIRLGKCKCSSAFHFCGNMCDYFQHFFSNKCNSTDKSLPFNSFLE